MLKFWVFRSETREKLSKEIERIEFKIARRLFIGIHKPQSIDSYRGLKTRFIAVEPAIEDQTRGFVNKEARWIKIAIEKLSSIQKVSRWIEVAIESYRECNKKKLKSSIGRIAIERYRDCSKIVFQRREKHKYECNQTCYSNKDPSNILSSQNHLSTRKMLST